MEYKDLLEIAAGKSNENKDISDAVKKWLSPPPLDKPEELEKLISTRYRYTGPGKWMKILREAAKS
ncbi:MAG: hypothetical protein PQJ61_00905 [Spirochaetales bacterium]|uniref:Uncharacterized protein n=1 Tax=Candidatus Thalassospirochaeta sargassi TaxID=3119039 RepID=A0AAJ1MHI5_9SPIO|nr:hypothetical protein [Spirochaetales bacterium]